MSNRWMQYLITLELIDSNGQRTGCISSIKNGIALFKADSKILWSGSVIVNKSGKESLYSFHFCSVIINAGDTLHLMNLENFPL